MVWANRTNKKARRNGVSGVDDIFDTLNILYHKVLGEGIMADTVILGKKERNELNNSARCVDRNFTTGDIDTLFGLNIIYINEESHISFENRNVR